MYLVYTKITVYERHKDWQDYFDNKPQPYHEEWQLIARLQEDDGSSLAKLHHKFGSLKVKTVPNSGVGFDHVKSDMKLDGPIY